MDLNQLLVIMVERKGELLYLAPGSPPLIKTGSGALTPLKDEVLSPTEIQSILEEALTPAQKEALKQNKELNIAYSVLGLNRFRVSIFYQRGTLGAVFHLTPPIPGG